MSNKIIKRHAIIIGAGPAGLTAGIELLKSEKFDVNLLEREWMVGGLARTTDFKGYKYDIGPHHFTTEDPKVEAWWKEVMGKEFLERTRSTSIFYNKHFFKYPLEPLNVLRGLSLLECARCLLSYAWVSLFPIKEVKSFQDWVTNKFGRRLFSIFFKTYTEKVWGIPCHKISADWAAQRIKGFSLGKALFHALLGRFLRKEKPRTLRETFFYPTKGAGMLWNRVATQICARTGGEIQTNERVVSIEHDGKKIFAVSSAHTPQDGGMARKLKSYTGDEFLSTMPLRSLILALDPLPAGAVIEAAQALGYRGLITVNVVVNKANLFDDHWLYIHEKDVQMGRIGNMNNFSGEMVADAGHTALCLEYFTFVGGEMWKRSDEQLMDLAKQELAKIGIVTQDEVIDGFVLRTPDAYPVYDAGYRKNLDTVLNYLGRFENLSLMGRNGMHRYNNMDHAMLSALGAVEKVLERAGDAPVHQVPTGNTVQVQSVQVAKKLI